MTPPASAPRPEPSPALPKIRRRRWRWVLLAFFTLVLLGIGFTPTIIAKTELRNRFARQAVPELHGSINIGSAALGWFSPIELRDVILTDAQGRAILVAPKVTSSKSLFALVMSRADLGEFRIESPTADIARENGTTNLEETIAPLLKDDSLPQGSTRSAVILKVLAGKITLRDETTKQSWVVESIDSTIEVPAPRTEPVKVKVAGLTTSGPPGRFDADLALAETSLIRISATDFPLDTLAPLLQRVDPGASVAGRLTANLEAEWSPTKTTASGHIAVANLDTAGPWFKGDHLKLASAELPLKIAIDRKVIRVEQAELKCDMGTLSAVGTFDPDESLDNLFDRAGVKIEADLDLAKLASHLPHLLRVREGTAIHEGKLTVKLLSRAEAQGTTWEGELRTAALKAVRDGKPIEWTEPLTVEFIGRVPSGHLPTFDKLVCRSDFVAINAQGSPESFRAAANVYLGRLSERLNEFVELDGARFTGNASAWLVASRTPQGDFKADAGVELVQFEYRDRGGREVREAAVKLRTAASGRWEPRGPVRLESGSANFTVGPDSIEVKLLEPIADAKQLTVARLDAKLSGGLDSWMNRIKGVVKVPKQYIFGGQVLASGKVRFEAGKLAIDRLLLGIENARFRGAGLDLNEPTLNAVADMTLDRTSGKLEFANFDINSAVLTVSAGRLGFDPGPKNDLTVSGGGNAITDLTRLGKTLKIQSDPNGSDALRGRGAGPIRFSWQGGITTFDGVLDVKDFAYGDPKQTGLSEPVLKLQLDGRYEETPDRLTFAKAQLDRPGLGVELRGTLAKLDQTQDAQLSGNLSYDFAKLTPELRAALGGQFQATGQGTRPIALVGSLSPGGNASATLGPNRPGPFSRLNADAGITWDSIQAYGFDMGPSELKVKLAGGVAALTPLNASFGGGKISLTPSLRLDPEPSELSFAKGRIVERAKLTPQVCAGVLGYALPVIANAAQAEGEISATLDENRIPLATMNRATLRGQLLVHKAVVGAGPIVGELATLLGAPATSITLANEMTVPVKIEGGRVYHENLTITINGYVVRTTGSVGFDGSLIMVADLPIPPGLLKNNPIVMKALSGKTVKVPITGTMARPVVDPRLFQASIAALARDSAKDLGRDFLNKELDKLFPGMQKK